MSGSYNPKDSELIASLVSLSAKSPKLVKSSAYGVKIDGEEVKIRSWKMNEFKYYDIPSPFPTLARGLFTRELESERRYLREEIDASVERGPVVGNTERICGMLEQVSSVARTD